MTLPEKIEGGLILLVGVCFWLFMPPYAELIKLGNVILVLASLSLVQSLVRDLWLLAKAKRKPSLIAAKKSFCLCLESVVGAGSVLIGILLLTTGIAQPVLITDGIWSLCILLTMALGFAIKDWVIVWRPFGIRREKDHANIIFSWKN
jgi:hypothetical protein